MFLKRCSYKKKCNVGTFLLFQKYYFSAVILMVDWRRTTVVIQTPMELGLGVTRLMAVGIIAIFLSAKSRYKSELYEAISVQGNEHVHFSYCTASTPTNRNDIS